MTPPAELTTDVIDTGTGGAAWFRGPLRDGCAASPSCFACPLADCRRDEATIRARRRGRADAIAVLLQRGLSLEAAAREAGVSRTTAYRRLGAPYRVAS